MIEYCLKLFKIQYVEHFYYISYSVATEDTFVLYVFRMFALVLK